MVGLSGCPEGFALLGASATQVHLDDLRALSERVRVAPEAWKKAASNKASTSS